MRSKSFSKPQRQSKIGVVFIFLTTLYKIIRGFWAVGAYVLFTSPSEKSLFYLVLGLAVLGGMVLIYSYVYYQKFIFHIDYEKDVFVLKKGVFSSEDTEISFDKIQQVDIQQSLLQRFIGVHSLIVDTAGGKEKEVKINAISKAKAEQLSTILMQVKEASETEIETEEAAVSTKKEAAEWSYKMTIATLIKIGISSNYFRGLAIIGVFFATIFQELNRWFKEYSNDFDAYVNNLPDPTENVSMLLLVAILLLLGSILITIIEVFIKYFNLKLKRTSSSLQLEMGLKNNKKITIQPRRVQLLQITTNPIQKKLNLHELKISVASSENNLQKSKIKIPGLGEKIVSKVNAFLYQTEETSFQETFKPHIVLFYRKLLFSLIPILLSLVLLFLTHYITIDLWVLLAVIYSAIMGTYQWFAFKSLRIIFSENFTYRKHGVWSKVEDRIETYKMQAVTVAEPYFYQKRNLVNLVFHTAGGDISFKAVDKQVLPYINFALYKIESSKKDWM